MQLALEDFLKPGDTAIDLGANIGALSVFMSRAVGAEGRVVAFEANPFLLSHLHETIAANSADNVQVVPLAVWSSNTYLDFFCEHSSFGAGSSAFARPGDFTQVRIVAVTLDGFLQEGTEALGLEAGR